MNVYVRFPSVSLKTNLNDNHCKVNLKYVPLACDMQASSLICLLIVALSTFHQRDNDSEACNIIRQQDNQLSPVVRSAVAGHQKQDEGLRSHILRKRVR